ncbi:MULTISPECIES: D-Ala-D-Ala carboxypeptidase family metallohydrolase [Asticcacaulis]|uniref:D-Ala-D-Ala carboxypeptidase family metallohydrolase n=1 Tax=Asticcacaulis TaxID=76890 RepID=UPI001AE3F694|nr:MULTISPECIES: D-Ala-D-Ala carboxypeptidase family metallohydrolase [Asticcacaulis]MBP2161362.1 hypothetical protein [Asticcacaulis solisilvae]MDR6802407.1 hypothetical protein [Asticcacaulis sp. BE141]
MPPRFAPLLLLWLFLAGPVLAEVPARFSEGAFAAWRDARPDRQTQFTAFQSFLTHNGVADVLPAYQLWRTSSSSEKCQSDAFIIPERADWPHIVTTLRFVRDQVRPAIGPVEAVSGYRDDVLNTCSGGAKRSAHRNYYALDLVPLTAGLDRATLIKRMCAVHAAHGAQYSVGLGFYSARRFHVDSKSFRRWGPDGTGKTSPCNASVDGL